MTYVQQVTRSGPVVAGRRGDQGFQFPCCQRIKPTMFHLYWSRCDSPTVAEPSEQRTVTALIIIIKINVDKVERSLTDSCLSVNHPAGNTQRCSQLLTHSCWIIKHTFCCVQEIYSPISIINFTLWLLILLYTWFWWKKLLIAVRYSIFIHLKVTED